MVGIIPVINLHRFDLYKIRKQVIVFFFFLFDEDTGSTVQVPVENVEDFNEQDLEFIYDDKIRKVWHKQQEQWYFSIIDVCQVLADSDNPKRYWSDLKIKLHNEGNETYENIVRLKLKASDGKMRLTDCANTEQLLRIIQSIPSKKAEPFKQWLSKIGRERLEEMADPEKALDRGLSYYRSKGYSEEWIKQRLQSKAIRDDLTNEWKRSGISDPKEFAALTNILTRAWSGKSIKEYKSYKGLHNENLRDNMTNLELTLNQLAEVSATAISKVKNPTGFGESKKVTNEGGRIARNARKDLEQHLGKSIISTENASDPLSLDVKPE